MRDGSLILIPVDLSKTRGFSMIDSVISPAMSSLWLPVPCVAKIPSCQSLAEIQKPPSAKFANRFVIHLVFPGHSKSWRS